LNITTDTIDFLSALAMYNNAYLVIQQEIKEIKDNENNLDISVKNFISILVEQIGEKSKILLKKYPPLKNILLINNYFYIHSRISQMPLAEYFDKNDLSKIKEKINANSKEYLKNTWRKVAEITFDDKNDIIYEKETNELKATSKELIKKRFTTFNDEMKINTKIQQHIQIIDKNIEMLMIKNNISYVCKRYQTVLDRYKNVNFTRNLDKIILYKNIEQVEKELKTYFSVNIN